MWETFLRESRQSKDDEKYMIVPMARIADNEQFISQLNHMEVAQVDASSEPQIAFRCDAQERFDETKRYGRCPKVVLSFWAS